MQKQNKRKRLYITLFVILFVWCNLFLISNAATESSTNLSTGYQIIFEDNANLITDSEKREIQEAMKPISEFGNVYFLTNNSAISNAASYADQKYKEKFGKNSGTLFLIDMYTRKIYIFSDGKIYKTITRSKALTITDNNYTLAKQGNYGACAVGVFTQINTLLQGKKIAEPMRFIGNIFFAIILSFFLNYYIMKKTCSQKLASLSELKSSDSSQTIHKKAAKFLYSKKVKQTSSSSGVGSGGGGGGSSGGGGGHSF